MSLALVLWDFFCLREVEDFSGRKEERWSEREREIGRDRESEEIYCRLLRISFV